MISATSFYDRHGWLSSLRRPDNSHSDFSYDSSDRLYQLSQYNPSNTLSLRATYSYDSLGRVTQIQNSTGPFFAVGYRYDARSQVTYHSLSRSGPTSTSTYSYDAVGHLVTSQCNDSTTRFAYDALGNRSKMNTTSGTSTYSYDASSGRMLTSANTPSGNTTFGYDANGNLKTKVGPSNTTTYTYDTLNHLTQIVQGGTTLATYSYNGAGQRVGKTAGGVTSSYLWDGSNLAQENRGGTYYLYSYLGAYPIAMTNVTGTSSS